MAGNCIGIADFAHAHGCYQLYEQARKYIYAHFAEVSQCEEFLQLSQSQVAQVLFFFYFTHHLFISDIVIGSIWIVIGSIWLAVGCFVLCFKQLYGDWKRPALHLPNCE